MREWWSKLRAVFTRDRIGRDLRAELDSHLQMEVEANLDRGMTPTDALDTARRRFGNRTAIEESSREAWVFLAVEAFLQDLRYGLRLLRRSPGFTLTAVSVMALGIGANTAAFTLVSHVLLRPLPYAHPDRLVKLFQAEHARGNPRTELTPPNFEDWRARSTSFSSMGAYVPGVFPVNLSGEGEPVRLDGILTSADVFTTLDVRPAVGRGFTAEDDRESAERVALLSDGMATMLFGSAINAIGRTVRLEHQPATIIGVMPSGFAFPYRKVDIWTPMRLPAFAWNDRTNHILEVVARLRPGVTLSQARADLEVISTQLELSYPKENAGVRAEVLEMRDVISPQSRTLVIAVFAAAFCLMLIACTNLANLLFARAMGRRQELAVRMAIGAARPRLVRQLLTENLFLATLGGAVGLLLALIVMPALRMMVPYALPIGATPEIDWRVFAFALVLTLTTSIAFGVGPAFRSSRTANVDALRSRSATGGRADRLRGALVLAEVAGTVVLLVAAGLLLKAMWRVQAVDPGFRADGVLTMRTALPASMPAAARRDFYSRILADARSLPGVTSAAYMSFLPMTFPAGNLVVTVPGVTSAEETRAHIRFVTPDYFRTMGIPVMRGRDVSEADHETASRVTVISASLARRLWPEQDPIGRQMRVVNIAWTVVGLVGNVAVRGLERESLPQAYFPYDQVPPTMAFYAPKDLAMRASGDPMALAPAARDIIRSVNPDQAIADLRLLEAIVAAQTAPRRDQLLLLGTFAAIAFLLAAVGIHGLLSFIVTTRTREVGVRVALGAERGAILRMFLRQGVVLGVAGVAIALPLAYAAARGMRALLFGVEPTDPLIYALAAVLAMAMTLAGSLRPALRAATIDPASTIRTE